MTQILMASSQQVRVSDITIVESSLKDLSPKHNQCGFTANLD